MGLLRSIGSAAYSLLTGDLGSLHVYKVARHNSHTNSHKTKSKKEARDSEETKGLRKKCKEKRSKYGEDVENVDSRNNGALLACSLVSGGISDAGTGIIDKKNNKKAQKIGKKRLRSDRRGGHQDMTSSQRDAAKTQSLYTIRNDHIDTQTIKSKTYYPTTSAADQADGDGIEVKKMHYYSQRNV